MPNETILAAKCMMQAMGLYMLAGYLLCCVFYLKKVDDDRDAKNTKVNDS